MKVAIGVNGNGNRLTITDGGRVNNTQGQIGSGGSGTSNTVLVTGANTLWNNTTNLFIGGEGLTNQLTIADGGRVNCYGCYLGGALSTFSPGAQMGNSLWVTGSNSLLQASSLVRAGQFGGFSLLVITNGGTVNGNTGSVGGSSGSTNNTVILTGPGSSWHSASTLTLGSTGGKNSIRVANGAQLVNTRGIIGNGSSNNLVVVTGAGTLWSNATDLWVGGQIMSPHDNLLLVVAVPMLLVVWAAWLARRLGATGRLGELARRRWPRVTPAAIGRIFKLQVFTNGPVSPVPYLQDEMTRSPTRCTAPAVAQ